MATQASSIHHSNKSRCIIPTTKEFYEAQRDVCYDMAGEKKGVAMIVNITQGKYKRGGKTWQRKESKADVENLKRLFADLSYDVVSYEDLTLKQFICTTQKVARIADTEDAKSLFVVLMSFGRQIGSEPFIISSDGVYFPVCYTLCETFRYLHLANLAKRPKVFIVQAFQGGNIGDCARVYMSTEEMEEEEFKDSEKSYLFEHYLVANGMHKDRPTDFPEHPDFTSGSLFIQEMVKVFREKAATKDITELITEIRQNVWRNYMRQENAIQMDKDLNRLKKKFYIFPGI